LCLIGPAQRLSARRDRIVDGIGDAEVFHASDSYD